MSEWQLNLLSRNDLKYLYQGVWAIQFNNKIHPEWIDVLYKELQLEIANRVRDKQFTE